MLVSAAVAFGVALGGALLGALAAAGSAVAWCFGNEPARRKRRELALCRARRAELRELRLEEEGVARTVMDELTMLVDLSRRIAPDDADRYGLDDLLDLYADVAVTVKRSTVGATPLLDVESDVQRAVRIRTLEWRARVATLVEREDEIADLVRLYVAMAVTPEIDHLVAGDLPGRGSLGTLGTPGALGTLRLDELLERVHGAADDDAAAVREILPRLILAMSHRDDTDRICPGAQQLLADRVRTALAQPEVRTPRADAVGVSLEDQQAMWMPRQPVGRGGDRGNCARSHRVGSAAEGNHRQWIRELDPGSLLHGALFDRRRLADRLGRGDEDARGDDGEREECRTAHGVLCTEVQHHLCQPSSGRSTRRNEAHAVCVARDHRR